MNSTQWQLHDRSADGVVLVVDPIDRDVDVAATRPIDTKYGNAVLGGIVGVHWPGAGSQVRQIAKVSTIEWKVVNIVWRDFQPNLGFLGVHDWRLRRNLDRFRDLSGFQHEIDRCGLPDLEFHAVHGDSGKSRVGDPERI